ncbi:MAG: hypothetical protein BRC47_13575, partial [Cyanobacteria bacterium QS_7_48_42]
VGKAAIAHQPALLGQFQQVKCLRAAIGQSTPASPAQLCSFAEIEQTAVGSHGIGNAVYHYGCHHF